MRDSRSADLCRKYGINGATYYNWKAKILVSHQNYNGIMSVFIKYFSEEYNEDGRLQRHRIEFVSATYILDKVIHDGSHILDVGTGTVVCSRHCVNKGCSVVAIDAVPRYIKVLYNKIKLHPALDIQTYVADVKNLSIPLAASFDVNPN